MNVAFVSPAAVSLLGARRDVLCAKRCGIKIANGGNAQRVLTLSAAASDRAEIASKLVAEARSEKVELSRREVLQSAALAMASGAAIGIAGAPQEARADRDLMTAKRSYFRYAPRFEGGIDFYVLSLYPAIKNGDWNAVLDAYEPKSDAVEGSKKAEYGIDRKVSDLQRKLFDPMSIWANSFAEKGTGPNFRYLSAREETLEAQMKRLKAIASGGKLSADKQNDGMDRQTAALDAWQKGRDAINEYISKANTALSRELRKLDTIPDDLATFEPHDARPKPYGSFQ
mmetsp:Transcript_9437/g.25114  ORF Transcript_9437/g.25114 Transcript_9437/m.25114 type:complete len:285 (+) Transcript_9437:98-952(+)